MVSARYIKIGSIKYNEYKFRNSDRRHKLYSAANRKYDVESRINLNQKAVPLAVNCVFILVSRSQTRLGET